VPKVPDFELPSLDPVGQARDAAEGKVASIGTVNPRPPGLIHNLVQAVKKLIARLLDWHVRDQVDFNRAVVRYMDKTLEAQIEQNENLLRVARNLVIQQDQQQVQYEELRELTQRQRELAEQQADILNHWKEWHPAWEERLTRTEIDLLHGMREIEAGARSRETGLQERILEQHQEYLEALSKATDEIQQRLWASLQKSRSEQEALIHTDLRVIRRRAGAGPPAQPPARTGEGGRGEAMNGDSAAIEGFDYARFEERFRGDEAYVAETQKFYLPQFQSCQRVLDLGCGRGEFLELLREQGVAAAGVDLDADAVAACAEKKLNVVQADLFRYLAEQPEESFDGVFCAHVVEHLPAGRLPAFVSQVARALKPRGLVAVETPNPDCLAIFAGDFYLDPTHNRPVPSSLLHFLFQEAGLGEIEVHELHPAAEVFPEIAALDKLEGLEPFRRKFFGGLNYAILGRKMDT
jgi:O-antigen chain-terminating methyltransferase